jgi:hypothetical protein
MSSKISLLFLSLILFSCASKKSATHETSMTALYEILYESENLGANIQFYEIVSEKSEFKMLLSKDGLKGKVKEEDIETSNFLLLNMGEKNTGGFAITVESVVETPTQIEVKVKQITPKPGDMVTMAFTYPICIVKINSKKPIVFQ